MDERRYYGLDALRGTMMMLGIVLHGAMFYMATPHPFLAPLVDRAAASPIFDALFHLIHSFRMPAFFVLSGFFTALLVEKRGAWGAFRNRAARVAAPLVAGTFTIVPVTLLLMVDVIVSLRFGTHALLPERAQMETLGAELKAAGLPVDDPGVAHLWFLYYLCWFYLLIPACRALAAATLRVPNGMRRLLESPAALLVAGLWTAATLWPFPGGQVMEGFVALKPHAPSLIYYGSFFVFGYVLHAHRDCLKAFVRFLPWIAPLIALLFPLSLYLTHLESVATADVSQAHLAAVIVHGLCTWALIYLFVGLSLRFFDHESPWTLYVSQSSYWVFLMHMPAVSFAAWALLPYALPGIAKFTFLVAFAAVVCFATYHYAVQRTWVSVFLNGKRFNLDWPWRKPAAVQDASP